MSGPSYLHGIGLMCAQDAYDTVEKANLPVREGGAVNVSFLAWAKDRIAIRKATIATVKLPEEIGTLTEASLGQSTDANLDPEPSQLPTEAEL